MQDNGHTKSNLSQLRKQFIERIPGQIEELIQLLQQAIRNDCEQSRKLLLDAAHKFSGTSLALGFTRLGMLSQAIEYSLDELNKLNSTQSQSTTEVYRTIQQKINSMMQIAQKEKSSISSVTMQIPGESITAVPSLQESRSVRIIYLIEDDPSQAEDIVQQIGYFGYLVKTFATLQEASAALQESKPAVILIDLIKSRNTSDSYDIFGHINEVIPDEIPLIFISSSADIKTRLQAVRARGKAFFTKPINIGALIDVLDRLMVVEETTPIRILIIDDDNVQAAVNSLHLSRAGMETTIITDPMNIIHTLQDINPDLILLDMYMPDCSGIELAVVIRQIEAFVSIPIVFLSTETDREKQLEAVGMGGDDFLTKPIKPEHLIASVSSRVERYRQLRYLMMRDSLTGLLNHTTLKERYAQEINRAVRQNKSLTYAMVDLDYFKKVNDTYGHSAGDRVLKSLASMLTKRLRNTDVIGRYGGEEFAILMPNTNSQEAARIFEELRTGFEHIHHQAISTDFKVTFSCGISSYPECGTASELAETADKALYTAKKQGRNRVVIGIENQDAGS